MDLLSHAADSLAVAGLQLLLPALVFAGLTLIVKGTGALQAGRAAWSETVVNLGFYTLDAVLIAPPLALLVTAMKGWIDGAELALIPPATWEVLPPPLTIAAALLVGDLAGYWRHRLEHTAALWPSHAVHHSDTEMTWLGLARMHPINRLTTTVIDNGVLLLCGFPPSALVVNAIVRHFYGYFVHADLPWTLGPLSYVLVSPAMHRWHHANDRAAFNTNFATVFSIFDRAFGTLRVPGPCTAPLGVSFLDRVGVVEQLAHPFRPSAYGWLRRSTHRRWTALRARLTARPAAAGADPFGGRRAP